MLSQEVVPVSGTYLTKPPGDIVLFMLLPSEEDYQYWPQNPIQIDEQQQSWNGEEIIVSDDLPQEVDVVIAIMDKSGSALVDFYHKVGEETEQYPSIEKLTEDIIECDRITITRIE